MRFLFLWRLCLVLMINLIVNDELVCHHTLKAEHLVCKRCTGASVCCWSGAGLSNGNPDWAHMSSSSPIKQRQITAEHSDHNKEPIRLLSNTENNFGVRFHCVFLLTGCRLIIHSNSLIKYLCFLKKPRVCDVNYKPFLWLTHQIRLPAPHFLLLWLCADRRGTVLRARGRRWSLWWGRWRRTRMNTRASAITPWRDTCLCRRSVRTHSICMPPTGMHIYLKWIWMTCAATFIQVVVTMETTSTSLVLWCLFLLLPLNSCFSFF